MSRIKPSLESCLGSPLYFYGGSITLRFAKDPYHQYFLACGASLEPVDGVTSACGILDKSMFLVPWSAKMTAEKILRTMPSDTDELGIKYIQSIDWDSFATIVLEAKKAHREKLADASDVGAQAHDWLDRSIQYAMKHTAGRVEALSEQMPNDQRAINCGNEAYNWMRRHNVVWLESEKVVYSRKWNFAGTMDGMAYVDDQICIIDWKSSNALRTEYLYQTAAYQAAYEEEHGVKFPGRWILRLGKEEGDFESWFADQFDQDFTVFTNLLTLKKNHGTVEARIAASKKAVKKDKNVKN